MIHFLESVSLRWFIFLISSICFNDFWRFSRFPTYDIVMAIRGFFTDFREIYGKWRKKELERRKNSKKTFFWQSDSVERNLGRWQGSFFFLLKNCLEKNSFFEAVFRQNVPVCERSASRLVVHFPQEARVRGANLKIIGRKFVNIFHEEMCRWIGCVDTTVHVHMKLFKVRRTVGLNF